MTMSSAGTRADALVALAVVHAALTGAASDAASSSAGSVLPPTAPLTIAQLAAFLSAQFGVPETADSRTNGWLPDTPLTGRAGAMAAVVRLYEEHGDELKQLADA